jgi:hypothetical protein
MTVSPQKRITQAFSAGVSQRQASPSKNETVAAIAINEIGANLPENGGQRSNGSSRKAIHYRTFDDLFRMGGDCICFRVYSSALLRYNYALSSL